MATTPRMMTVATLQSARWAAIECLRAMRYLCSDVERADALLDEGISSELFLAEVSGSGERLVAACEGRDEYSAEHEVIELAMADELNPLDILKEISLTAHESTYHMSALLDQAYSKLTHWEGIEGFLRRPYTEYERLKDCRYLVHILDPIGDEFQDGLDARIEIEHIKAKRWILDRGGEVPATIGYTSAVRDGTEDNSDSTEGIVAAEDKPVEEQTAVDGASSETPPRDSLPSESMVPPSDDAATKPAGTRSGGRKPMWDDLWDYACKMKEEDPKVLDKEIVRSYNKRYGAPIKAGKREKATVKTLRNVRYERTNRSRNQDHE